MCEGLGGVLEREGSGGALMALFKVAQKNNAGVSPASCRATLLFIPNAEAGCLLPGGVPEVVTGICASWPLIRFKE
jgi:hypothetical protein